MRDLRPERSWAIEDHVWREVWLQQARQGVVYLPYSIDDLWAQTLRMVFDSLKETDSIRLVVNCTGGMDDSFEPCKELLKRRERKQTTNVTVTGQAGSVALSYVVVCTNRLAVPDARFMAHGERLRAGEKVSASARDIEGLIYLEDHYFADWMARFTRRSYEEWLDFVDDGKNHWFTAQEALEWGVIDEVLEGV